MPPILIRLVRDPIVDEYDLSFLRRFSSGAAPLSEEILHLLKARFPQTGFKQGYGMTESCSCITAHPPTFYDYKYAHAVGTICASTQVKIIKDDGLEGGVGDTGEIWAKVLSRRQCYRDFGLTDIIKGSADRYGLLKQPAGYR